MVFYKIASTWTLLTSHDYNGIVLTLLGGVRVHGNTCVYVKRDQHPVYPIDFYKIASKWTPLTSHDYNFMVLTLYALDGPEEFEFVETRVFM